MRRPRVTLALAISAALALVLTGCPRPNGYTAVRVFPNLNFAQMVGLYPIPDGSNAAVVLTKDGMIYRADPPADAAAQPSVFLDLRDRIIAEPGFEEGLLGFAFSPDYVTSGRYYVYFTAGSPRRSVVSRFTASGGRASEQVLLEVNQPYANHNGGPLAFGPDGLLYIGLGDGGSAGDPHGNGQNTDVLLGKVLRIDVSGNGGYTIPRDNPFAGGGGAPEVYAWGLRNPWRLTFDTATGALWAGDVGQGEWEEVNRVVRGGNYGWSVTEGDACYARSSCDRRGLIAPRITYSHEFGCSITGGYVYRGAAMPELDGWYVYGDFCSGRVWAIDAGTDVGAAIPLADTGAQISSFAQDAVGEIYLVTFDNAIYRLVRG